MVGKIKRVRQKLHHGAVRLENENRKEHALGNLEKAPIPLTHVHSGELAKTDLTQIVINRLDAKAVHFPRGVFAGTKISPESLVQTLKFDEPSNVTVTTQPDAEPKGSEEQKQQSKKSKMKDRRERWLNKISTIKQEREQQVARARRKATPVVGDMRPLADALPELSQLLPSLKHPAGIQRKNKTLIKRKPEPTDYSVMKPAQKRKILEAEASNFSEAMKNPAFKTNPFAAIGEHLRKRLKQEDEQS